MAAGFDVVEQEVLTHHLRTHYARVLEELTARADELRNQGVTAEYIDSMSTGLRHWVKAADAGNLAFAIHVFRKPS
ncbi:hypothetical protein [Acuticoccus mangrovi]|uniref:Uncharacterized protein n=1 Tax=Acuticoccus mangrovi TaxID=2796142 RepID=A0A934ISQ6_9HYPH|nr:hypothetical protein [Acuticoccus mangrovi]MBJ3776979.1 hypothetical protein [Acuticoccus mangrovi]